MKIILKENIENLGKRGDIVNVAAGYGRNYLLPKKLAIQVTPSNLKMIEMEQKALRKKLEKETASYNELIGRMNGITLTFKRKVADKDALFGSVSITDIREALIEAGFEIEKKKILLSEPIKTIGEFTVSVKVFHDENAEVKILVVEEGAGKKAKADESPPVKHETPSIETAEEDPEPASASEEEPPAADASPENLTVDEQEEPESQETEKEAEEPEDTDNKD